MMNHQVHTETLAEARTRELKRLTEESDAEIAELRSQLLQANLRLKELERELSGIRESLVWTMVMRYHVSVIERFLPVGSMGRNAYELCLRGIRGAFNKKIISPDVTPDLSTRDKRQIAEELNVTDNDACNEFVTKYGKGLVCDIDERDEMYQFLVNHPSIKDPRGDYFRSGEVMLCSLEKILGDMGTGLDQIHSFLDFACGYGRFTRFLVSRCGNEKITVSDIDRDAVDFQKKSFKVKGFYSTSYPAALDHSCKYDIIFVASLFSHLYLPFWEDWLRRLYAMLENGGLLILSTHGVHCYKMVDNETKKKIEVIMDGFYFLRQSETGGRLPTEVYGTTYVDRPFVENFIQKNGLGKVVAFYPKELWNFQDVYVIKKA
jgi:SAM-dependent methyltransferase